MRELDLTEIDMVSGGHDTSKGDHTLRELHEEGRRRRTTGRDYHCTTDSAGHIQCEDIGPASEHQTISI